MRARIARLLIASTLGVVIATCAPLVHADDAITQCIAASDKGLDLRKQGKLVDARKTFASCAIATCGADIKDTCEKHIAEINAAMPTLQFEVKDGLGNDLTVVTVSMDGKPLLARLEGTAVSLDPGQHSFHFEAPGQRPIDKTLVLSEGQKDRRERVVFGAAPGVAPVPESGPAHALGTVVISADAAATISLDGKVAGTGACREQISSGSHVVSVTEQGKTPYRTEIDLREGETRTLEITLQSETHGVVWPWLGAGSVLVAGAIVGGYFLFKPSNATEQVPTGKLGGVQLSTFGGWRR